MNKKPNRLINEKSPYLLQHAYNPVDWYPWCEEAFEKAKKEDKPIFLSIGYSSCHWCHVMEKESFEDEEVAEILNQYFVSIKVDREERPDVDAVYMNVCMLFNGNGGWPLTIIMTPDKKPFFAGTYFPKHSRPGRIGLIDLLLTVAKKWKEDKEDLISRSEKVIEYLKEENKTTFSDLKIDYIHGGYYDLKGRFDNTYGGFSNKPKFPTPHNLMFLLRYYYHTKEKDALDMVEKTLLNMRLGGIYDHVGFGFHRYSTDRQWLLPHFEKMLYDQAMLLMAYTESYQLTQKDIYKQTAQEIIQYVLRDMTSPEGMFYSAEDADSEGEEGKFYTWTIQEIKEVLKEDADVAIELFNIKEEGNFLEEATGHLTGRNVLHLKKLPDIPMEKLESIRQRLFEYREKRIHPLKDDKMLTDWNGLMIAGLSKAAKSFGNEEYTKYAEKATNFIIKNMIINGKLYHLYKDGQVKIKGMLDDYAFFVWGLIELYEATGKVDYLQHAINLSKKSIELFYDEENGGFYLSKMDDLIVKPKESFDGAIPSGNSVSAYNLYKLYLMTGDEEFYKKSYETLKAFGEEIKRLPSYHTMFLIALMMHFFPTAEVVISGSKWQEVLKHLNKDFLPNKVVLVKNPENRQLLESLAPYTKEMDVPEDFYIYLCKNFTCNLPVKDIEYVKELIRK
ncbi:thioredoxin domain-containing protein [Sulfurihydrogenibium sp.]|uniref:thioredoxin domain-containing protein n=1 Tax=Sulfurihydrogenibium sp. TaxID=2053621 RepID=UPI002608E489|nr:thioredoxin domain-containing protein [Sulfurihydrogenibium sp.]